MSNNVIVRQHIDDLLTTSTLAGAQSTLGIKPYIDTVVQANSATWNSIVQQKLPTNNPTFTGVVSSMGPVIVNVNTAANAMRITQTGAGNAFVVEDNTNPDATAFIITSAGNVGIGRDSSNIKLDIVNDAANDLIAAFNGTGRVNNGVGIINLSARNTAYKSGFYDFRNENNIPVARMLCDLNTNGSSSLVFSTTPSGSARDQDRRVERIRISNSGFTGINTNNPTEMLHVNGNLRVDGNGVFSGNVTANGNLVLSNNTTLQIPTSAWVRFGNRGENTDDFMIGRFNTGQYFGGRSELRIVLGDDPHVGNMFTPLSASFRDSIVIGTSGYMPWTPKIELDSSGLISCFGDYTPNYTTIPNRPSPAIPLSAEHLTTKAYVDAQISGSRTPAGAIMTFAMSAAPAGWLYCNGAAVSRTTYNALFSAIGTTYGGGNGTTTFNLPDLRGEFVRGWDNGRGIDSGRTFASTQKGTITLADPSLTSPNILGVYSKGEYTSQAFALEAGYDNINIGEYSNIYRASVNIAGNGSFGDLNTGGFAQGATRPRNIALYYCIKI